jgi:hypothetical protein
MISFALASTAPSAQEGGDEQSAKPGLYTTVDEHSVYLIKGEEQIDVKSGESVFVSPEETRFIDRPPAFLNWPCGTEYAGGRGSLQGYSIDELPPGNRIGEIVRRWFEDAQLLAPMADFANAEFNGRFSPEEIDPYVSSAYWYRSGPQNAKLALQRPQTLIVGLFRGTGQVIVDNNHLDELRKQFGNSIPVVVEYQEENVVPVSYFGDSPKVQDIIDAWVQRGIRLAEVPMWYGGDQHLSMSAKDLALLVNAPPLSDIDSARHASLEADLAANGFTARPVNLTLVGGQSGVVVDEAERVRVAESMGIKSVPVMFSYFNELSAASHCGLAPPVAEVGALGQVADDSPGPLLPERPPEIQLPNPPQPELPVSGS